MQTSIDEKLSEQMKHLTELKNIQLKMVQNVKDILPGNLAPTELKDALELIEKASKGQVSKAQVEELINRINDINKK